MEKCFSEGKRSKDDENSPIKRAVSETSSENVIEAIPEDLSRPERHRSNIFAHHSECLVYHQQKSFQLSALSEWNNKM